MLLVCMASFIHGMYSRCLVSSRIISDFEEGLLSRLFFSTRRTFSSGVYSLNSTYTNSRVRTSDRLYVVS